MTQNQLRYWELRWKQHYENILAQVKVQEVAETRRHNIAVEAETERHNRRQEKIDTQNMIINRMNLEARWAELDEKKRAALVAEALNEKKYQLAVQQELHNWTYTQAQIQDLLRKQQIAAADFAMSVIESKHNIANKYLQSEASLVKAGWGKALAGEVIADVKSQVSDHEFDQLLKVFSNSSDFQWLAETFGPASRSEVLRVNDKEFNTGAMNLSEAGDYNPQVNPMGEYGRHKARREQMSIDKADNTSKEIDDYLSTVQGHSSSANHSPSTIFVDSGRSHSNTRGGTDYYIPGGHHSSGVIYA